MIYISLQSIYELVEDSSLGCSTLNGCLITIAAIHMACITKNIIFPFCN